MAKIRKAVIPAAGKGTRFRPFTYGSPKEMYPIIDKPTIHYVIDEARSVGVKDILVITGESKRSIEDYFQNNPEFDDLRIHTVRQPQQLGLGHAVGFAEDHVGDEPFYLLLGDDITIGDQTACQTLREAYEKTGFSTISVHRVPEQDVSRFGIIKPGVKVDDFTYNVDALVEKPTIKDAPSNLAIVGKYLLDPKIFDCIRKVESDKKGEIQLTDALRIFTQDNTLLAREFTGKRYDLGNKNDALRMSVEMALMREDTRELMQKIIRDNANNLE